MTGQPATSPSEVPTGISPVCKSVTVPLPRDRAFAAFTGAMGEWWIDSHSIGTAPQVDVIVERRNGGRWFERGSDGTEATWGHVLRWEPPMRVVFAWQLTAIWRFDPDFVTELEVRFSEEGPAQTRVDLEHRMLERFGDKAAAVRQALDSPDGWQGLLDGYLRRTREEARPR
jgi:hypothetical protein